MKIRPFEKKDHEAVQDLLLKNDSVPMASFEEMGGYGLVIEDETIVGFVWALISHDSSYAMINYFVVKEEYRSKSCAALLMTQMLLDLLRMRKEHIVGMIKEGASQADSLARIYASVGMDVSPAYVVSGSAQPIVDHMLKRFKLKEEHGIATI